MQHLFKKDEKGVHELVWSDFHEILVTEKRAL